MAKVYITEYSTPPYGLNASAIAVAGTPGTENSASPITSSGSSQQSTAFAPSTVLVRIHTDGIISYAWGTNPTATTSSARMAANQTEYFGVPPGFSHKIAVITNT